MCVRDADTDLAPGRKTQNSSKAGERNSEAQYASFFIAKCRARIRLMLNSGIAASTMGACSTITERLQFGLAMLAEVPQRMGCVAVHQLAKFRNANARYCSLRDAVIWKMCTLAEFPTAS
jgi:hypothetical protein